MDDKLKTLIAEREAALKLADTKMKEINKYLLKTTKEYLEGAVLNFQNKTYKIRKVTRADLNNCGCCYQDYVDISFSCDFIDRENCMCGGIPLHGSSIIKCPTRIPIPIDAIQTASKDETALDRFNKEYTLYKKSISLMYDKNGKRLRSNSYVYVIDGNGKFSEGVVQKFDIGVMKYDVYIPTDSKHIFVDGKNMLLRGKEQ